MTEAKNNYRAILKKASISPRKARLVVDLVRGCQYDEALQILSLTNKKASALVKKLIMSASENAMQKETVDKRRLFVSEAFVDDGPTQKRWLPRAQGRATPIRKRSSHITIKLQEL